MDVSKGKGGSMGLTYPMLTKTNYTTWALKMKVVMQAHGVWDAVEQTDPKATMDERTDKIALAMIYQGVSEEVLLSIAEKKRAKDAWEAIKILCQGAEKVKNAKVQTLKAEFEALTMKDSEQLDDFCMKLSGLVTNIRSLGEEMKEAYVVKKLLRAVPTRFLQIASTIEQFGNMETMTVEETVGSLKAHDERLKGQGDGSSGSSGSSGQLLLTVEEWAKRENEERKLLLTREEWLKKTKGGGIDSAANYRMRGGRDKSKVRCFNCQLLGHFAAECRKPRRVKETQQEAYMAKIEDDEPALLLANHVKEENGKVLLNEEGLNPKLAKDNKVVESNVWYLDNGASNHMTGVRSKFNELDKTVTGRVKFGDGSAVKIEGKGSIIFKCKNGEQRVIRDVYFIPTLCSNILSLGQLAEEGNKVVMNNNFLWIFEKEGNLLMKVKRSFNRLYKIIIENVESRCLLSKSNELSHLWHMRLGHVNFKSMELMHKENMVHGLPKTTQTKEICSGCLMSKQTRRPFPAKANYSADKVLRLVHGDLCGPIEPTTTGGNRYFFLLVDDYSRYMWVYFLKSKDEAFGVFKKFRALVEDGPDKRIRVFRTDRGGEFTSKEFVSYCEEAGIERHYTAPYTPQQNGVVERRNRTIVEMARSCLKEMNMPCELWGEAVRHSVYLLNRLPTRALSLKTPYEIWKGEKPNISHIRVFGCVAHMKVPKVNVSKLDDRSMKVINLGREPGSKAYRLYEPDSGRLFVSRDVMFDEMKSWPWNQPGEDYELHSRSFSVPDEYGVDTHEDASQNEEESLENQDGDSNSGGETVRTPPASPTLNPDNYDDSCEPKCFRRLSDVYRCTEEVEMEDELLLMGIDEPENFKQAEKGREWKHAMNREIESIEKNGTWYLTELPEGHKVIGLKWIYKLKKDADGKIIKYKARLVAKGYVQERGVDFDEIFAPVTRLETVRLLLALAAKKGWEVHHLDVKTAFLNGEICEEVYVAQPEGYVKKGQEKMVYRLLKALYGLRQAPRAWYAKLSSCLENLGFKRCAYEHAVYIRQSKGENLIVGVYVDDLLITGTSVSIIEEFKEQMNHIFEMSDMGRLSYYLGIEVKQGDGYIELKQTGYARKILERNGMIDCNPTKYPMDPKEQLDKDEKGKLVDGTQYRSMVGCLRYLVHTRPDLAYAVGIVSRYMENPTVTHQNAVKRIMRYVKGTLEFGLVYSQKGGNNILSGYSDSNLAGDLDDRKSTGGMVFYLNESVITWVSQKQKCVALSSCEAEYMAATAAACQGVWLRNVLSLLTNENESPVVLYVDNKSAIDLAKNPVFHGRSKHIDIRFHFIRGCIERGEIEIKYVASDQQRADVLTKALSVTKFERMRKLLGVRSLV